MTETAPIRATVHGESSTGPLPVVGKDGAGRHRAPESGWQPVHYAAAVIALLVLVAVALAALGVVA